MCYLLMWPQLKSTFRCFFPLYKRIGWIYIIRKYKSNILCTGSLNTGQEWSWSVSYPLFTLFIFWLYFCFSYSSLWDSCHIKNTSKCHYEWLCSFSWKFHLSKSSCKFKVELLPKATSTLVYDVSPDAFISYLLSDCRDLWVYLVHLLWHYTTIISH